MTYALAWRTPNEVFMAADSAMTTRGENITPMTQESSFGEGHFVDDQRSVVVEERVVKLFLRNNVAITFAGSYRLAINIITSIYDHLGSEMSPRAALEAALFTHRFPQGETVQLAIGYFDTQPRLISFNSNGDLLIREDEQIVQIGNPLPVHRNLSENWIRDVAYEADAEAGMRLSALLGVFQSYTIFSPQMERGIGGSFSGLYVDSQGGRWQPDILFIEYGSERGKIVSTCFRHNCLVVNSPTIGQSRCLMSYTLPADMRLLLGQTQKAIEKGRKLRLNAEYEYVVIFHAGKVNITLIEMQRNRKHTLIWLQPLTEERRSGLQLTIFPALKKILNRTEPGLFVAHFAKSKVKSIPEHIIDRSEINENT